MTLGSLFDGIGGWQIAAVRESKETHAVCEKARWDLI